MKVGIIGSGFVGATTAYAILLMGTASEVVLVDMNRKRAEAEAADIRHAVPFVHPMLIRAGDYSDLSGAEVVIITAGSNQKPGESRLELLGRNASIMTAIVEQTLQYTPNPILVIATNPVDIMTHIAAKVAVAKGLPSNRVIGSGTTLDTARFRSLLGDYLGVDAHHVHGYVIGEHGDSEVLTWSIVDIGGVSLQEFAKMQNVSLDQTIRQSIDHDVRSAAYQIIEGKGATYYGIGAGLSRIIDVFAHDHRAILTVCTPSPEVVGVKDVTISMPRLVRANGVIDTLPFKLSDEETLALQKSASMIRARIDEYEASLKK
jgi:L-lactate dehydrogenase